MKRKVKIGLIVDSDWEGYPIKELPNFIIKWQKALSLSKFQLRHCTSLNHSIAYWFHPNYIPANMGNPHCCPYFTIETVLWKKEKPESL